MTTSAQKTALFCVLNWGLGHATRSIPLIQSYLKNGWKVVLLSDGQALEVLKESFPNLPFEELPAYGVRYSTQSIVFNMLFYATKILRAIRKEHKVVGLAIIKYHPTLIISDNRYGCRHPEVKSILITHQLSFPGLSPLTRWVPQWWVRSKAATFAEVWIPDFSPPDNLTGKLAEGIPHKRKKYIGPLSRMEKQALRQDIDYLFVLSGIEPSRTILEEKIISFLPKIAGKKVLVRGLPLRANQLKIDSVTTLNYASQNQLSNLMNRAKLVVARAGYSTIMDCVKLGKKAILIPTPGQPEQEYLARYLKKKDWVKFIPENQLDQDLISQWR